MRLLLSGAGAGARLVRGLPGRALGAGAGAGASGGPGAGRGAGRRRRARQARVFMLWDQLVW